MPYSTPEGQRAQQILDWAYEAPGTRASDGLRRVNAIAARTTGRALLEVQDAGSMLARLASVPPGTYADE